LIDTTEVDAEGIMFKLNPQEADELSKRKYQWFKYGLFASTAARQLKHATAYGFP
jgi:hypothetical protein